MDHQLQLPPSVWQLVEDCAKLSGVREDKLVEEAVRIYVGAALSGVPAVAVTPPVAVLSRASSAAVRRRLEAPASPTAALRALMKQSGD